MVSVPPEPGPTYVVDTDDDPDLYEELHRRADVAGGVIVVRPVPGAANERTLAADVLIALGKHFDAVARERQTSRSWELVRLWARAERIRHLVVCDAERLALPLVTRLTELAAGTQAHLWLVARPTVAPAGWHGGLGSSGCPPVDLLGVLPVVQPVAGPSLDHDLVLPRDNFLTFRAACRRRLSPEQFAAVDAVYRLAHGETQAFLQYQRPRPRRQEVLSQLRALVGPSLSAAETIVRLRAAQAAYFRDGALVELADVRLGPVDIVAVGLSRQVASRLRRLVTPSWCCALALAAAGGLYPRDLARLRLGAVHPEGIQVEWGGDQLDVPDHGAGLVRAQVLARRDARANDDDPLFTGAKGDRVDPIVLDRQMQRSSTLAAMWWGDAELVAAWQAPAPRGHLVRIVAMALYWELAASA